MLTKAHALAAKDFECQELTDAIRIALHILQALAIEPSWERLKNVVWGAEGSGHERPDWKVPGHKVDLSNFGELVAWCSQFREERRLAREKDMRGEGEETVDDLDIANMDDSVRSRWDLLEVDEPSGREDFYRPHPPTGHGRGGRRGNKHM